MWNRGAERGLVFVVAVALGAAFAGVARAQVPQATFPELAPSLPPIESSGAVGGRLPGHMTSDAIARQQAIQPGIVPSWGGITQPEIPSPYPQAWSDAQVLLAQQSVALITALVDAWLAQQGINAPTTDSSGGSGSGNTGGNSSGNGNNSGGGRTVRKASQTSAREVRVPSEPVGRSAPDSSKSGS